MLLQTVRTLKIGDCVLAFTVITLKFRPQYGPGVDLASNRND
jgi:hypothetical protein